MWIKQMVRKHCYKISTKITDLKKKRDLWYWHADECLFVWSGTGFHLYNPSCYMHTAGN